MTDPKPYDRCYYHGKLMDQRTKAALIVAERRLGYELTITQGCYSTAVDASANTHAGGGAVDLAPYDARRKVRVLRDLGFAAWHREPIAGLWPEHIHAVLLEHSTASDAAKLQWSYYRQGLDGLADHASDPMPYRPDPIPVFDYRAALRDDRIRARIVTLRARIRDARERITYKGGK